MKSFIRISLLFLLFFAGMQLNTQKASAQVSVSFQVFYDDLSPYGDWVETPNYGYVWVPNVAPGFSPYGTNGYWVFTDYGWTWVSDYPWGWAPFHYGRWYTDPFYGPMWVPGNVWGPGWVTWRHSGGYYGWAPIEPGIEINIAYSNSYHGPRDQWRFVRDRDFGRRDIHKYYVNSSRHQDLMQKSSAINNPRIDNTSHATYNSGPDRNEVQRVTGSKFSPVKVRENAKPGQQMGKNELQIYRPHVDQSNAAGSRPVPTRVVNIKDVKPASQRGPQAQPGKPSQPAKGEPRAIPNNNQPPGKEQPRATPNRNQPPVKEQPRAVPNKNQPPVKEQPRAVPNKNQPPVKEQPRATPNRNQPPVNEQPRPTPNKVQPAPQIRHEEPVILKPLRIDPPNKAQPTPPAPRRETPPNVQPQQPKQQPPQARPAPRQQRPALPSNRNVQPNKGQNVNPPNRPAPGRNQRPERK